MIWALLPFHLEDEQQVHFIEEETKNFK